MINTNLGDIPWNFMIGNGVIIEGRGFYHEGVHTANLHGSTFNDIGICIAFIGNYNKLTPNDNDTDALFNFFKYAIDQGVLSSNFSIFYQDQLTIKTVPADGLNDVVKTWDKWLPSK